MEMTFDILDALGSIATFLTFLYLFRRDNDKQTQINALTALATTAKSQLKFMMLPDIRREGVIVIPDQGRIDINIENFGEYARLTGLSVQSEGLVVDTLNLHLPYPLDKGKTRRLFFLGNGLTSLNETEYEVLLQYTDRLGNPYAMKFMGTGSICNIGEADTIDINALNPSVQN